MYLAVEYINRLQHSKPASLGCTCGCLLNSLRHSSLPWLQTPGTNVKVARIATTTEYLTSIAGFRQPLNVSKLKRFNTENSRRFLALPNACNYRDSIWQRMRHRDPKCNQESSIACHRRKEFFQTNKRILTSCSPVNTSNSEIRLCPSLKSWNKSPICLSACETNKKNSVKIDQKAGTSQNMLEVHSNNVPRQEPTIKIHTIKVIYGEITKQACNNSVINKNQIELIKTVLFLICDTRLALPRSHFTK